MVQPFSAGIEIERIEAVPQRTIPVEFWIAPVSPRDGAQALPHLQGLKVVQSLYAGVDWLLKMLPSDLILCDAQSLHNIPTAEWTVSAILAALKHFPFYRLAARRRLEAPPRGRPSLPCDVSRCAEVPPPVLQEELHGKRVMILGYGLSAVPSKNVSRPSASKSFASLAVAATV